MVGHMSNAKWRKIFELPECHAHPITIKTTDGRTRTEALIAEIGDTCIFVQEKPYRVDYKTIEYISFPCTPDRAKEIDGIGKIEYIYHDGRFHINAF